jgi:hypothetical protein
MNMNTETTAPLNAAATLAAAAAAMGGGDTVTVTETTHISTGKPGLFSRLGRRLENNPIKTAVTVSAGIGAAAVGTYSYFATGSAIPPMPATTRNTGDTISGLMSFFGDNFR